MPEPIKPVEPAAPDYSKYTKEQWGELAKTDPGTFAEQTQTRFDTMFRQGRESQEKLAAMETREKNLLAELNALKTKPTIPLSPEPLPSGQPKQYGNGIYPQTKDDWNDLFIEDPIFANDLRNEWNSRRRAQEDEYSKARTEGVKTLITEHPDMYHVEVDADGKPKLKDGKPIVMVDPQTGLYAFNAESEKGKLWMQLYNEDPQGWNSLKNAPSLMMAEMERRLRMKGANMLQNGQNNKVDIDQSGVAPEGVNPPKAVSLKFASEEEKAHAQSSVNRGTYKSLEEYVQLRDQENRGYTEPNRRPDFSKR